MPRPPVAAPGRLLICALAGLLGAAGLGVASLALLRPFPRDPDTLAALQVLPEPLREALLSQRPAPPQRGEQVLTPAGLPELFARLEEADRSWIPRAERQPDGSTRYLYRRRLDEPLLSLDQIRQLMREPPTHAEERRAIATLVDGLQRVGVQVVIGPPRKRGAAGEWDPGARTIRMGEAVVEKGSLEFARVLNHETIHVAQSCRTGGLVARPRPLGLSTVLNSAGQRYLEDPVYARAGALELRLEREAYANQTNLQLGPGLLLSECHSPR